MGTTEFPAEANEIWFRPKWARTGRVGAWHLLAAGEALPGGSAVCGYAQCYQDTGFETTTRDALYDQARVCTRCASALERAREPRG